MVTSVETGSASLQRGLMRLARRRWWLWLLFLPGGVVLLSLLAALLILVRISFNVWDPVRAMMPAWTVENYTAIVLDPVVARALLTTLRISGIVALTSLIIGYPVALGIARAGRFRPALIFLLITPMLLDVLIRAYGWIVMLGQHGLVNVLMTSTGIWPRPHRLIYTEFSVILELIHELVPFMVLPLATVLQRIDPALREAAMNLRAGPGRTFISVTLPLSAPGIFAGTFLTFALSMSAFVAPLVLGGGNVITVTMLMRQHMFTTLNWPMGSAESVALVAIVFLLLSIYRRSLARAAGSPS